MTRCAILFLAANEEVATLSVTLCHSLSTVSKAIARSRPPIERSALFGLRTTIHQEHRQLRPTPTRSELRPGSSPDTRAHPKEANSSTLVLGV